MSSKLRLSALARVAALLIVLSFPSALIGCARSISPDDSYFLGANRVPVAVGVGIAG